MSAGPLFSRAPMATAAARLPPALSPPTETRVGIDLQHLGVLDRPRQRRIGIVVGDGKDVLGRHAIVDRHHGALGGVGDLAADPVVAVEVAQHPAAAVIVDVHGQIAHVGRAGAAIEAHGNGAMRPLGLVLLDPVDLRQLGLRRHAAAPEHLASLERRQRIERRPAERLTIRSRKACESASSLDMGGSVER